MQTGGCTVLYEIHWTNRTGTPHSTCCSLCGAHISSTIGCSSSSIRVVYICTTGSSGNIAIVVMVCCHIGTDTTVYIMQ